MRILIGDVVRYRPDGEGRGKLAMVMANAWRGKDTAAMKSDVFMPFPDEPVPEKQSAFPLTNPC